MATTLEETPKDTTPIEDVPKEALPPVDEWKDKEKEKTKKDTTMMGVG
jgi:hypothetical protein